MGKKEEQNHPDNINPLLKSSQIAISEFMTLNENKLTFKRLIGF